MSRRKQPVPREGPSVLVPSDVDDDTARAIAKNPPHGVTVTGSKYGNTMVVLEPGGVCKHCGANPPIPTRDGLHKCQCRMERV